MKLKIGALSQKIAISAKKIETDQSSRAQMIARVQYQSEMQEYISYKNKLNKVYTGCY